MEYVHIIYFSPALSTRKVMRTIGQGTGLPLKEYDITLGLSEPLTFGENDLVIVGVPVYSGRVPSLAAEIFAKIRGNNTPIVIVCVYGNRDYDDALLELQDVCEANSFRVIAGGAFIARHSIFPRVAVGRPDEKDKQELQAFGEKCMAEYQACRDKSEEYFQLVVKGNRPYKEPSRVPVVPTGNSKCDECGICVKQCPMHAIPGNNPRKTDKSLCISCARCITLCPQHARNFRGILYKLGKAKFESNNAAHRDNEMFYLST